MITSAALLLAQTLDTAILGVVTDPSGSTVPSAEVTVTQSATGFTQKIQTNHEGAYEIRYLRPGEYTIDIVATGFTAERRTNIVIQTGQTVRLNVALQVGQVAQRADVVAEVPLMQTENAALGEVVSTERVTNLPLNGRRFLDLAALTPGVTVRTESQFSLVRANGTRDTTQALSFDGVKATSNRWAFVAIFPPLDAIQEFRVQTGNFTAEYGGNAGANINVQLRSGTNALHGVVYEYLRNDKLDARNYFSPAPLPKDVLRRNQFGAVVSGPILRDKLFFMVGWESQRNNQESGGSGIVLTPAQRQGNFSAVSTSVIDPLSGNPFPGNMIPANRLNPVSVNLANTYLPLANQPGLINYAFLSRANTNWDQGLIRVDYRWRDTDQFSWHYMGHNWNQVVIPQIPIFQSESPYLNQNLSMQHVHTFSPTFLNEFRFGYHRGTRNSTNPGKNTDFTAAQIGINGGGCVPEGRTSGERTPCLQAHRNTTINVPV